MRGFAASRARATAWVAAMLGMVAENGGDDTAHAAIVNQCRNGRCFAVVNRAPRARELLLELLGALGEIRHTRVLLGDELFRGSGHEALVAELAQALGAGPRACWRAVCQAVALTGRRRSALRAARACAWCRAAPRPRRARSAPRATTSMRVEVGELLQVAACRSKRARSSSRRRGLDSEASARLTIVHLAAYLPNADHEAHDPAELGFGLRIDRVIVAARAWVRA